MPTYLCVSVGVLVKRGAYAPEQNQKNLVILFIIGWDCLEYKTANKKRTRTCESMEFLVSLDKNGMESGK